jgi:hypothetical protein
MKQFIERLTESKIYHAAFAALLLVVLPHCAIQAVRVASTPVAVVIIVSAAALIAWGGSTLIAIYKPKEPPQD